MADDDADGWCTDDNADTDNDTDTDANADADRWYQRALFVMADADTDSDADAGADGRYQCELFVMVMALSIIEALDQSHPNPFPPYPKYIHTHALTNYKPIFICRLMYVWKNWF